MKIYEINNNSIIYKDMLMKKSKEFKYNGIEYIQFLNNEEHKFIVMEKIFDNKCIEITNMELIKKIIEANFKKASSVIE